MTEGGVRSEELLRSRICGWHLPFTIQPCLPLSVQSVTFRGLRNEGCPHSVQLLMLRKGCSIDYDYSMFIQPLHLESFQDALATLINFDWPQQVLISKLLCGPLYSSRILLLTQKNDQTYHCAKGAKDNVFAGKDLFDAAPDFILVLGKLVLAWHCTT